jgi:hypothetical protein
MKRLLLLAFFSALVAGTVAYALSESQAGPIESEQYTCLHDGYTLQVEDGRQVIPGLIASIRGGRGAFIVQLSADLGVDPGAEVRVSYRLRHANGTEDTAEGEFGPTNFANHQEFFEGRMLIAVIPANRLPRLAGTPGHIEPLWRVSGPPGATATITNRCVTVE